ncbi:MAG TPA: arsenic transporter [Terracidiphilus sp.]|nr:arsenic transporter [Terracidiphilus sp.]
MLLWLIVLAALACILLRPKGIAEAWWAACGALLLVAAGLIPARQAVHAVGEGLDVYLFLAGMMVLAEIAREEGVFDWAAGLAASHARGSASRLFLLVYLVGVAVTALLSNDATAVVLTPAVLAVAHRARVQPEPYLLSCALVANAASFVFPISNPANLVVFDARMPSLLSWLRIFLLPSAASILLTYLCLRWQARRNLAQPIAGEAASAPLTAEGRLALGGLFLAAGTLIAASAFGLPLGALTCAAAALALLVVAARNPRIFASVARGVSWSVLPLVAGLFVLVEGLENAGLLAAARSGLQALAALPPVLGRLGAGFAVGLLSNGLNNLPVGLASGAALRAAQPAPVLAHAVLIGVDLGPNLSVTGSLATILWLIVLRREGVHMSGWTFLKLGLCAMPLALAASLLALGS